MNSWFSLLDNSKWLHHISGLIKSALVVVTAIDVEERPVLGVYHVCVHYLM